MPRDMCVTPSEWAGRVYCLFTPPVGASWWGADDTCFNLPVYICLYRPEIVCDSE